MKKFGDDFMKDVLLSKLINVCYDVLGKDETEKIIKETFNEVYDIFLEGIEKKRDEKDENK